MKAGAVVLIRERWWWRRLLRFGFWDPGRAGGFGRPSSKVPLRAKVVRLLIIHLRSVLKLNKYYKGKPLLGSAKNDIHC